MKWFSIHRSSTLEVGVAVIAMGIFCNKKRFNLMISIGRWFVLIGPQTKG